MPVTSYAADNAINLDYAPDGRVLRLFFQSDARVRGIMGPVGSGKTSACLIEIPRRAFEQKPDAMGVRRSRWLVLRDTYNNVQKSIESWRKMVARNGWGSHRGGNNEPARWSHDGITLQDGTRVQIEVIFAAVSEENLEAFMQGLELTGGFINEADKLPRRTLQLLRGRVGRYPSIRDGGPSWYGVWFDFNAPDYDSWAYEDWFESRPKEFEVFTQPGGMDAAAENLTYLPGGRAYYTEQIAGAEEWYIRRFIHNQFGYSRAGKPVYPEFNHALHVSPSPLVWSPHFPIILGVDAGRSPALIPMQRDSHWRCIILGELIGHDVDARQFGEMSNAWLAKKFPGAEFTGRADPTADNKHDTDDDEGTWLAVYSRATKIKFKPARSNKPSIRQGAVRSFLTQLGPDGRPMMLLDPRAKMVIRGFASGYRFKKQAATAPKEFAEKAEKNAYSHPHDGVQYGAMEIADVEELGLRAQAREVRRSTVRRGPARAYHPHQFLRAG